MKLCSSCVFKSWCDRLRNRQFPSPRIAKTFLPKLAKNELSELVGEVGREGADRICADYKNVFMYAIMKCPHVKPEGSWVKDHLDQLAEGISLHKILS